ncbi:hypothetical protein D3C72_1529800 [compost metagenome]
MSSRLNGTRCWLSRRSGLGRNLGFFASGIKMTKGRLILRVSGAYTHLSHAFIEIVDRGLFTFFFRTLGWAIAEKR